MKNPHRMGAWSTESKSHVAHMNDGDFYGSEKSVIVAKATDVKITLEADGTESVLKESTPLTNGEVIDCAVMSVSKLREFFRAQIKDAKVNNLLLSLHMKATMMKVSDPIIFGHAISVFFEDVFTKYSSELDEVGVNPNIGLGDVLAKIVKSPKKDEILAAIESTIQNGPRLAMVDSDKGITNFHVPSDVIIDASMPAMIRTSGQMWGPDGNQYDTKAMIPDRSYAGVYQETMLFCKRERSF